MRQPQTLAKKGFVAAWNILLDPHMCMIMLLFYFYFFKLACHLHTVYCRGMWKSALGRGSEGSSCGNEECEGAQKVISCKQDDEETALKERGRCRDWHCRPWVSQPIGERQGWWVIFPACIYFHFFFFFF